MFNGMYTSFIHRKIESVSEMAQASTLKHLQERQKTDLGIVGGDQLREIIRRITETRI